MEIKRDRFTTGAGVLFATLGSAVGLGNIWKFPFLTGSNGGAAFLIIYLISTLLVGLPVMIAEHAMGRTARADAVTTLRRLSPSRRAPWWLIGAAGGLAAFFILAFYTEVAGWVFAYILQAIAGSTLSTDPAVTSGYFTDLIQNPLYSLLLQWGVLIIVGLIIWRGVSKGIEKTTKSLMPVLFVLLIIVCVRSLTLDGAGEGLAFLFQPDFSKVTANTFLVAMGLAFFKLSVGMGTMITYGSYFRDDQNIPVTATRVMLADLVVSMLAGMAIFPAVFAFGYKPDAGPSLLFVTIPSVFASMPFGQVFMVLFFVLVAIAATGAMLSLFEVPVAYLIARTKLTRFQATAATILALAVVGAPAALSSSLTAGIKPFGLTSFDLYDFVTSNILLPVGGLAICIFVGWVWGEKNVRNALSNCGKLNNEGFIRLFLVLAKFVSPVLILLVLLRGLSIV